MFKGKCITSNAYVKKIRVLNQGSKHLKKLEVELIKPKESRMTQVINVRAEIN